MANNSKILSVRNLYFSKLDALLPPKALLYAARPLKLNDDGTFIYKFPGIFQEFDFKNSIIVMKDLYGRTWKFKYIPNEKTDNYDKLMFNEMVIAKDKSSVTVKESLKRFPKSTAAV
ncbi:MAG: hypothetical protein IPL71_04370 [Anaerolineales bacterium]|uniref:hypothetical protein n=1 Tax=Candidatus Villigracilis proximus TaxID=3140683 RepID=UPI00313731A2|nr:hypothetical protein [Anaerolineales bacterium]